jgi:hypothetical protein
MTLAPQFRLAALVACTAIAAPLVAHEHDGHDLDAATAATMVKLLDGKKLTLSTAVAQAANVSGGTPVSACCVLASGIGRPTTEDPKMAKFTMYCIEGKELWDVHLDSAGPLLESGTAKREGLDPDLAKHWEAWNAASRAMSDSKMTLAKAIETAEKHTKGRALAAAAVVAEKTTTICAHCLVGDKVVYCIVALDGKVTDVAAPAAEKPAEPKKP